MASGRMGAGARTLGRLVFNLVLLIGCVGLPLIYPFLRSPDGRAFVVDALGMVGPWIAPRLLALLGFQLALLSLLADRFAMPVFRGISVLLAEVLYFAVGLLAFRAPLYSVVGDGLPLLGVALWGLLVLPERRAPGTPSRELMRPGIVLGLVGLAASLLMAHPPWFLYSRLRPTGELSIRNVLYRDPELDLDLELSQGTARVVCTSGLGLVCPPYTEGAGYEGYRYLEELGYVVVEGTSDAIPTALHRWLNRVSYDYAERHNEALLRQYDW